MTYRIVYTQTARSDLRSIYEYIADTLLAVQTAVSMTETIMSEIRSLASMPERCPLYREEPWRGQGVRVLSVKRYLIFYTVQNAAETVSVARIMYGGRDIKRQLEQTKEW